MKKKTIHCHDVLGHICEELDSKISSAKCRALKAHLEKCPNCTAYLDSLRKTITLYKATSNPRLSRKTHDELFAVLDLKGAHSARKPSAASKRR
jgi:anti-sigma factor RsiW